MALNEVTKFEQHKNLHCFINAFLDVNCSCVLQLIVNHDCNKLKKNFFFRRITVKVKSSFQQFQFVNFIL